MKLADLQAKFQDAVIGEDRAILDSVNPSRRLDRAARFAVYSDAYRLRHASFLAEDYPMLRNAMGEEDFGALVEAYIAATRSHHPNARWYGRHLPEFLTRAEPWGTKPDWLGLALLERALADAFDADDAEPCDVGGLAGLSSEAWPALCFDFQASISLLSVVSGTCAAYEAAAIDAPPPQTASGAETILVWRGKDQQAHYRKLETPEALALTEARAGRSFGAICSMLAFRDKDDAVAERAASLLARWFGDGLIKGIRRDILQS